MSSVDEAPLCPACGEVVPDGAVLCTECGASLQAGFPRTLYLLPAGFLALIALLFLLALALR